ncbi:MAG: hypothetical protein WBG58_11180, partial [Ignavibacteriaceae bacterium]
MKLVFSYSALTVLVAVLLLSCSTEEHFNSSFNYSPGIIKPGQDVTVKYNPDSSNLNGKDDIRLVAYLYGNKLNSTLDVPLTKNGSIYSGNVRTEENTLG